LYGKSLLLRLRFMIDRGMFLTVRAIRRQLAAMPHDLYLIRLIHSRTRKPFPGERLWTATQLCQEVTVRFLRIRNREGCDVYIQPYAEERNAGYVLVDLDETEPTTLEQMRANGHEPCVVLQSSPGHLQTWVHVSVAPLETAVATMIGRQLARAYGGDLASSDWRHLGRLAGFTNQKPQRRQFNGDAPWVKLLHTRLGLATGATSLLQQAESHIVRAAGVVSANTMLQAPTTLELGDSCPTPAASEIYRALLNQLWIPQRFPQPDWSIADKWVAKELLRQGMPSSTIAAILQRGSPGFPRRHADPQNYLRRTIARAIQEIAAAPFPAHRAPCVIGDTAG
jgi:hypothetical protein